MIRFCMAWMFVAIGCLLFSFRRVAAEDAVDADISFEKTIRPILKQHCWQCHGEEAELQGKLDTRLVRFLLAGGEHGPAIVRGKHRESLLHQKIASDEMPPGDKKVPRDQLKLLAAWIDQGAKVERTEPETLPVGEVLLDSDRQHWAFQPIQPQRLPRLDSGLPVRTPIDAFLGQALSKHQLSFSPPTDRATLLRRLYLDLLGLPPDVETIRDILQSENPFWYEDAVERVLSSPEYGERWGRHWLDIVGYADSNGYTEKDIERKWAWRYRDYVIRCFNADKPWNTMIEEQLAGDELVASDRDQFTPLDRDRLIATGYLRMVPDGTADGAADLAIASNDVMSETIKVVSSSLLGLTVGCAQCHSHRYDPISDRDYYAFRAIFEPALSWKQWKRPDQRLVSLWDKATQQLAKQVDDELKAVTAERDRELDKLVQDTFDHELSKLPENLRDRAREVRTKPAADRSTEDRQLLKEYPFLNVDRGSVYLYLADRQRAFNKKWDDAIESVRKRKPAEDYVHCLVEPKATPGARPMTYVFHRGDIQSPRDAVQPNELSILRSPSAPGILDSSPADPTESFRGPSVDPAASEETKQAETTSGRRLAYARHLVSGNHPLVARVLVNRFWMHHFGRGIVATTADFGLLGLKPTHPELLDWLAYDFMQHGWSLKHLHRQILLSDAYRQSSSRRPELEAADPDNVLLGRMPVLRLEGESIRDSILSVAGNLSLKRFGPPVPVTPDEVGQIIVGTDTRDSAGRPTGKKVNLGEDEFRRSIYIQMRRSMPLDLLEPFDQPVMVPNCSQRACSTVAPQSLVLMNSHFIAEQSEAFAHRITKSFPEADQRERMEYAWMIALGQKPTEEMCRQSLAFLGDPQPGNETAADRWVRFCQALFCSNAFLYRE
jgi:mono/diheme cytochrome c family protein